jgi:enamine deaminase RidA (YjgF/YER057c/UK114 family)
MPRRSIHIGGFAHASPIPNASRIGNVIASGFIRGTDPATGKLPPTMEEQIALMFTHVNACVEAGGGTMDDILKITIWVEKIDRKPINDAWVKWFKDPHAMPARQVCVMGMEPGVLIQCDFLAVLA